MINRITRICVLVMQRFLPDAFLFAVLLTFITFVAGMIVTGQNFMAMVGHWGDGAWSLLGFSMQMALVLVCGHTLASSKPVARGLQRVASLCSTPESAIMLVSLTSAIACWLNWGFGLVVGALLAKEVARKVQGVDYRLLIASAYSGFLVWHGGLSGSIPLTLASPDADLAKMTAGVVTAPIPVTKTIFSALNLTISGVLICTLPFLNRLMHPKQENVFCIYPSQLETPDSGEDGNVKLENPTPAERLERARWISWLLFTIGAFYIGLHFYRHGFDLNLNIVILIFLSFAILLHGRPISFIQAFNRATTGAAGILLQFPFYAGIMGLMMGTNDEGVSLASAVSQAFVHISTQRTFPLFSFLSAGLVNIFVPSGGGQWAVQGPIMMPAGAALGIGPEKIGLAIAWGDAWTNMIQPFWALPALGIAGLSARDIMGFCLIDLLYSGLVISLAFLFI